MLSKKDLILAKKTYEANKLKYETKHGSRAVYTPAGSRRPRPGTTATSMSRKSRGQAQLSLDMSVAEDFETKRPMTSSTFTSPISRNGNTMEKSASTSTISTTMPETEQPQNEHAMTGEQLIKELGRRGLTGPMKKKKQDMKVTGQIHDKIGTLDYDDPDVLAEALSAEDFYMPKVTKKLPNGATLMDVYRSKQEDTWAKILKSQLADENRRKVQEKIAAVELNEKYGIQLRDQLRDNDIRRSAFDDTDDKLAALVEATSKKADDVQKARKVDAIERHKQFIRNALEDIELKRVRKEKELAHETEAAVMTNNRVKALIAEDKRKVNERKGREAQRLADLWTENQRELKRKADIKLADGQENLRIFREGERRMKAEDDRRAADLASKLNKSSDGPAHRMHDQVTKLFLKGQDEFELKNMKAVNCLNKQLQSTEEFALARKNAKGLNLEAEMEAREKKKAKEEKEEYERMRKIQEYNANKRKQMEREDTEKAQKKRDAALRYQRELDQQLNQTRQRSFDSMRKTMSEQEARMNSGMLRQLGVTVET